MSTAEVISTANSVEDLLDAKTEEFADVRHLVTAANDVRFAIELVCSSTEFWALVDEHVSGNRAEYAYAFDMMLGHLSNERRLAMATQVERRVLVEGGLRGNAIDRLFRAGPGAMDEMKRASIDARDVANALDSLADEARELVARIDGPPAGDDWLDLAWSDLSRLAAVVGAACMILTSSAAGATADGRIGLAAATKTLWQRYGLGLIVWGATRE